MEVKGFVVAKKGSGVVWSPTLLLSKWKRVGSDGAGWK